SEREPGHVARLSSLGDVAGVVERQCRCLPLTVGDERGQGVEDVGRRMGHHAPVAVHRVDDGLPLGGGPLDRLHDAALARKWSYKSARRPTSSVCALVTALWYRL